MRPKAILALGVATAAIVAVLGGAWLVLGDGSAVARYERAAVARWAAAKPAPVGGHTFRATACGRAGCVLVEAGGLAFVVGAGEGAGEGLVSRGLMRRDLDGVLIGDLRWASIRGLAAIGEAAMAAGRTEPLRVYAPDGSLMLVDGANLTLAGTGSSRVRLAVGAEGEDQGLSGKVVYDSGVVRILAFAVGDDAGARVYRIDLPERSLIVAGCSTGPQDVIAAARGASQAAAIVSVASERLFEIEKAAALGAGLPEPIEPGCMSPAQAFKAAAEARLSALLVVPVAPEANDPVSLAAWRQSATFPSSLAGAIAAPGTVLDLTGKSPVIRHSE